MGRAIDLLPAHSGQLGDQGTNRERAGTTVWARLRPVVGLAVISPAHEAVGRNGEMKPGELVELAVGVAAVEPHAERLPLSGELVPKDGDSLVPGGDGQRAQSRERMILGMESRCLGESGLHQKGPGERQSRLTEVETDEPGLFHAAARVVELCKESPSRCRRV